MYYYIGLGLIALLVIWIVGSYLVIRNIESPNLLPFEKRSGMRFVSILYIIAKRDVKIQENNEATSKGFGIIADYIFGNNTSRQYCYDRARARNETSEKLPRRCL